MTYTQIFSYNCFSESKFVRDSRCSKSILLLVPRRRRRLRRRRRRRRRRRDQDPKMVTSRMAEMMGRCVGAFCCSCKMSEVHVKDGKCNRRGGGSEPAAV